MKWNCVSVFVYRNLLMLEDFKCACFSVLTSIYRKSGSADSLSAY